MELAGKSALVTGGATGIGWGIAKALAEAGCRVAISGRREDALRAAADSWAGSPAIAWQVCDVANRDSVRQLFQWTQTTLGPLDILVNSAGTNIKTRSMAEMLPEQWDEVMAINATGV